MKILRVNEPSIWEHTAFTSILEQYKMLEHTTIEKSEVPKKTSDDNDGDGRVDFGDDSGCSSAADTTERESCSGEVEPMPESGVARGSTAGKLAAHSGECATDNGAPEAIYHTIIPYPAQVETVEVWNRCGNYDQRVRLGWHQILVGGVLCANNTAPAECGPFYSQCGGMEGDNVTVLLPRDGMLHLNEVYIHGVSLAPPSSPSPPFNPPLPPSPPVVPPPALPPTTPPTRIWCQPRRTRWL